MRRIAFLIASAVINASTIPAVASECLSTRDIDASRARWATMLSQPVSVADQEKTCRAYATSFYEFGDAAAGRRKVHRRRAKSRPA